MLDKMPSPATTTISSTIEKPEFFSFNFFKPSTYQALDVQPSETFAVLPDAAEQVLTPAAVT